MLVKMEVPSLDRFYPEDDPVLGIQKSDVDPEMAERYALRYYTVLDLIDGLVSSSDLVVDVGSGSGYGTEIISKRYERVVGIEPNEKGREYSRRNYRGCLFADDLEGADVALFVESFACMTPAEMKSYLSDAKLVVVTCTILPGARMSGLFLPDVSHVDALEERMRSWGFDLIKYRIDKHVPTELKLAGEQFFGVFTRFEDSKPNGTGK